ncbi:hypothetical protein EON79_14310 [bacterium]|nr:MAG: hypothetical protein EON79_14310 [bacterium]
MPLNATLSLLVEPASGGHRVAIRQGDEELAFTETPDLLRLLKRPGSVVAAAPIELRNDMRTITVKWKGRSIGAFDKHDLIAFL